MEDSLESVSILDLPKINSINSNGHPFLERSLCLARLVYPEFESYKKHISTKLNPL